VWPDGSLKMNRLRQAQQTLASLDNCSCIVLLPGTPDRTIPGHMLGSALRTSLSVDPPKSTHFQHTLRAPNIKTLYTLSLEGEGRGEGESLKAPSSLPLLCPAGAPQGEGVGSLLVIYLIPKRLVPESPLKPVI
jgi:hypothetical protein